MYLGLKYSDLRYWASLSVLSQSTAVKFVGLSYNDLVALKSIL